MLAYPDYLAAVYAGVLGKVIGVYMGRPFEGWGKAALVEHFGLVDRYVAAERKVPLVVADDDISGTLTFARGLEDSGRFAEAGYQDFADAWRNYIIENRTILWWGGLGLSTEHTAFLRLKDGVQAPASGSIAVNGKAVAEQIGAQIFIDAFGLVAPGRPELAARLAEKAAKVSHDGEAVYGAQVVAALVAAAFVEKDMDRLLDQAVSFIPADSLIAQVHRDVRAWARQDRDWHRTFARIDEKYGYRIYGGNCHIIPNHALMVMAWAYAPDSFRMSQAIVNTAGWDTDCNAANVGAVMGVKVGLAGINREYDFQGPPADRILLPTAEGTRHCTDCLTEAVHVARMGCRVMGWNAPPPAKDGAIHHFSQPGARHGYMAEPTRHGTASLAEVGNPDGRGLRIAVRELAPNHPERISTPIQHVDGGGYSVMGTPRLVGGNTATARLRVESVRGAATARLFVRHYEAATREASGLLQGAAVELAAGQDLVLTIAIPDLAGWPVKDLGIEIAGPPGAAATVVVDRVSFGGGFAYRLPDLLPRDGKGTVVGWINAVDTIGWSFSDDRETTQHFGCNHGRGVLVTGTTDWRDYTVSGRVSLHLAGAIGLVARYQGLGRYLVLMKDGARLALRERFDGIERELGTVPCTWKLDELHQLSLRVEGEQVVAGCDGAEILRARCPRLLEGGAGYAIDKGYGGFRDTVIASL